MSSSPAINPSLPQGSKADSSATTRWFKNPSYPNRIHHADRDKLAASLKTCNDKLTEIGKKLGLLANHPRRSDYERLFHQLQGARDQIAEAALRMPREAGALYHEDAERLAFAEQAFARVLKQWDAAGS